MMVMTPPASSLHPKRVPPLRTHRHLLGLPGLSDEAPRAVQRATTLTQVTIRLAWAAMDAGAHFVILLPKNSLVWELQQLKELTLCPNVKQAN